MPASALTVLKHHEYWRLWTALFAHGDLAHILGNLFLFVPFAYFLSRYFSLWLFPAIGFLLGGLINYIVIYNLPYPETTIIGVSGVVYWMGAVWMTLSFFIDRRETLIQRWLRVTGVSIVLFFPTTFLPEVSYLSHFLGYVFGVITGILVYFVYRKRFISAEVVEEINDDEVFMDWENFNVSNITFLPLEKKDFPMLFGWLNRDHVARVWGGPITQEEVDKKYGERLESSYVRAFIVYVKEKPIGFIQSYEAENFPRGVVGIDQFIADKNLIGRGIGSTFIKKFTDELLKDSEINSIITDPPSFNGMAIRAYKKAGFSKLGTIITPDGPAVLMLKKKEGESPSFYH